MSEGVLAIGVGVRTDYRGLARYHYRGGAPATFEQVLRAEVDGKRAGVLVVSRPLLNGTWRAHLWPGAFTGNGKRRDAGALNDDLRCISRVVVEPRYRGRGVGRELVRAYLSEPLTRWTEAAARMGAFSRIFAQAGMREVEQSRSRRDVLLMDELRRAGLAWWELVDCTRAKRLSHSARMDLDRALRRWANDSKATRELRNAPLEQLMVSAASGVTRLSRPMAYGFDAETDGPVVRGGPVLKEWTREGKGTMATTGPEGVPEEELESEPVLSSVHVPVSVSVPDSSPAKETREKEEGDEEKPARNANLCGRKRKVATAAGEAAPQNPEQLGRFLHERLGIVVPGPRGAGVNGSGTGSPFEYLTHSFFEGRRFEREREEEDERGPNDCVVWANRGGGKTFLGAVATMLDLVFKPGIQVRILGGSLEQSKRMQEHLVRLFEHESLQGLVDRRRGASGVRAIRLNTGSRAEVLAASETSVRGVRVQKVRCDEVELFDQALWRAVQLTTRSMACEGPWGKTVRGSVEALSTMHLPFGIMWDLVGGGVGGSGERSAADPLRRVFRWGLVDVLERCGEAHACGSCNLFEDCRGSAKGADAVVGHIGIEDAQGQKRRVDLETWRSEMLCLEPRKHDMVYPEFDSKRHVVGMGNDDAALGEGGGNEWLGGMDFGFRADTVILFARVRGDGALVVEHEFVASERVLSRHIDTVKTFMRAHGGMGALKWLAADPAGNSRNEQTGEASIALMREAGIPSRGRQMKRVEGFAMVRARLAPADGPVRLFVHARCKRLIESMRRYHFKPGTDGKSQEAAKGKWDHACDALRYMVGMLDGAGEVVSGNW